MQLTPAENAFKKGMAALGEEQYEDAAIFFESALRIEKAKRAKRPPMRYLSYYGLASCLARRPTPEAIKACEVAARRDFLSAELQLNLGRVYMLAGKTTRALAAFERGLNIAPSNKELRAEMDKIDRRTAPAIPWLRRNHPLNRWLGRMRSRSARNARRKPAHSKS